MEIEGNSETSPEQYSIKKSEFPINYNYLVDIVEGLHPRYEPKILIN